MAEKLNILDAIKKAQTNGTNKTLESTVVKAGRKIAEKKKANHIATYLNDDELVKWNQLVARKMVSSSTLLRMLISAEFEKNGIN